MMSPTWTGVSVETSVGTNSMQSKVNDSEYMKCISD
jgi:hypothetical protein